jgi:LPXTG-motif cell wall-anchored protein
MCIMSLSFVTGVMADTSSYAKTVTFSGMKAGDSVTAYRLVSYTTSYNDYAFAEKFGSYIDQFYTGDKTTALRTAYFKGLTNAQVGTLVSDFAAEAQTTNSEYGPITALSSFPSTATAAEGATTATASLTLEPGYYMVLGATTKENSVLYSPTCVFVKPEGSSVKVYAGATSENITDTLNVTMKTENAPELDKMSRNPDHKKADGTTPEDWSKAISSEVGDTVDFRIQVKIPAFNDGTKLNLTVKDTMTNMKFKTGSVSVYADEDLTKVISGAAPESGIEVGAYSTETHTQDLSIKLDFDTIHPTANAESIIYVYYQAIISEDSSVDNVDAENVAKLVYSNKATSDVTFETQDSKTDVDLYEIKLHKTDADNAPLTGAKFTLYEYNDQTTAITFSQRGEGTAAEYYPDDNGTITEVPCDSDGIFHIVGLDVGEYLLKETTVPTGYYAPSGGFKLTLKRPTSDGKNKLTEESTFTAENNADSGLINTSLTHVVQVKDTEDENKVTNNIYEIYLKNSATPLLPTAGGMGTIIFTIVGIAMMTAACVVIFARKKDTNVR